MPPFDANNDTWLHYNVELPLEHPLFYIQISLYRLPKRGDEDVKADIVYRRGLCRSCDGEHGFNSSLWKWAGMLNIWARSKALKQS